MLTMMYIFCSFGFLLFVHPLWLSLIVFITSIIISLFKFFSEHYSDMFPYLFVMVYSGGLLLLLVYMSSLVPNNDLVLWSILLNLFIFGALSMYMFMYNNPNMIIDHNNIYNNFMSLGMSYFLNHKELTNALIIFLLFAFCLISYMMSLLKYPMRSL